MGWGKRGYCYFMMGNGYCIGKGAWGYIGALLGVFVHIACSGTN